MIVMEEEFTTWLSEKLRDVHIDDDVLGSYISSIITSDEPDSEKQETIQDLLLGFSEDVDAKQLCCEVSEKWQEMQNKNFLNQKEEKSLDIVDKVALIMEKQAQPVLKVVNRSSDEEKLREAILTRSIFVSSDEECSDEEAVSPLKGPCQNQNAEAVVQAEKDRRESQKLEAEKKKVQDKTNREKQKLKQEERREKERKRTQKREHRR